MTEQEARQLKAGDRIIDHKMSDVGHPSRKGTVVDGCKGGFIYRRDMDSSIWFVPFRDHDDFELLPAA